MRYFLKASLTPGAGMAELADAADSKSADRKVVGVRPPLPAQIKSIDYETQGSSDAFFYPQTMPKVGFLFPLRFWASSQFLGPSIEQRRSLKLFGQFRQLDPM